MAESLTRGFVFAWPSGLTWATHYERVVQMRGVSSGNGSGEQVALRWQNSGGEYFGIVTSGGSLKLRVDPPIYMVKYTVDPELNVVKLQSFPEWDNCYLTGCSDSTVKGKTDLDKTASYWRVLTAPPDVSSDPSHKVLQFYSASRRTDNMKDGVFLVIYDGYQIKQYSYLEKHGVFSFDHQE